MIELAVLAPAFLGVIMLIVQFGLWFNARQIALAAAQSGARVAREEAGDEPPQTWEKDASNTAESYYRSLNTHLLGSLTASSITGSQNGAQTVGVKVSGPLGYSVFSWFNSTWTVTETVTGPVECFYPAADGGTCSPDTNGAGTTGTPTAPGSSGTPSAPATSTAPAVPPGGNTGSTGTGGNGGAGG
ncbi:MAG TPA: TadE/TadG family type IV pilus assembly protein [Trebonia sp.]|nr:TadE/TadG family type IV pilus assembly protein [Trebonia sp.]